MVWLCFLGTRGSLQDLTRCRPGVTPANGHGQCPCISLRVSEGKKKKGQSLPTLFCPEFQHAHIRKFEHRSFYHGRLKGIIDPFGLYPLIVISRIDVTIRIALSKTWNTHDTTL